MQFLFRNIPLCIHSLIAGLLVGSFILTFLSSFFSCLPPSFPFLFNDSDTVNTSTSVPVSWCSVLRCAHVQLLMMVTSCYNDSCTCLHSHQQCIRMLHILTNAGIMGLVNCFQSRGCKVVIHCGLNLHFPNFSCG